MKPIPVTEGLPEETGNYLVTLVVADPSGGTWITRYFAHFNTETQTWFKSDVDLPNRGHSTPLPGRVTEWYPELPTSLYS